MQKRPDFKNLTAFALLSLFDPENYFFFGLWHVPDMAQFSHPQPQEERPFFLSFNILQITAATIRRMTAATSMVPRLEESHAPMETPPLLAGGPPAVLPHSRRTPAFFSTRIYFTLTLEVSLVASL